MTYKAQIMDESAMRRALMRIAHEITEKNRGTDDLMLVGIRRRGADLAEQICGNIEKIEGVRVPCESIDIHRFRDDLTLFIIPFRRGKNNLFIDFPAPDA